MWDLPTESAKEKASLDSGIEVKLLGKKKGKMVFVKTISPFEVEGWIKANEIGCRVTLDTQLKTGASSDENIEGSPLLRKGALVRIISQKQDWIEIETVPRNIKIFSVSQDKQDELSSENVLVGYIIKGWIPKSNCSTNQAPYYDSAPQEGTLYAFNNETVIYKEKPQEEKAKNNNKKLQIPGKALKYTRWVEIESQGVWSKGYTDGPIVVKGWVQKDKLGEPPNTNPLYMIFIKDFKDYEVIIDSSLINSVTKKPITKLPGGTQVYRTGVDYEGCIVRTSNPIVVEGLIDCKSLRSLNYMPEKVIENTGKKPLISFPERGPKKRNENSQKNKKPETKGEQK